MFAVSLSYVAFIMLRYDPTIHTFWRLFFFNHKWVLNSVKSFLCIYWDDHTASSFQFAYVVYHIVWYAYIEESLHPLDKVHLITMYDPFDVLLDSVC